jgi:hypothetical protein
LKKTENNANWNPLLSPGPEVKKQNTLINPIALLALPPYPGMLTPNQSLNASRDAQNDQNQKLEVFAKAHILKAHG